jgi:hypothetical protein
MPVIPALWRERQEDHEFKNCLGFIVTLSQKKQKRKINISRLLFCLICRKLQEHHSSSNKEKKRENLHNHNFVEVISKWRTQDN